MGVQNGIGTGATEPSLYPEPVPVRRLKSGDYVTRDGRFRFVKIGWYSPSYPWHVRLAPDEPNEKARRVANSVWRTLGAARIETATIYEQEGRASVLADALGLAEW